MVVGTLKLSIVWLSGTSKWSKNSTLKKNIFWEFSSNTKYFKNCFTNPYANYTYGQNIVNIDTSPFRTIIHHHFLLTQLIVPIYIVVFNSAKTQICQLFKKKILPYSVIVVSLRSDIEEYALWRRKKLKGLLKLSAYLNVPLL